MVSIILLLKFLSVLFCALAGYTLGWFFTEKFDLASKSSLFRFQAFECRKCLTFHCIWVLSGIMACLFVDWKVLAAGVICAALTFIGLKVDQKNKTVKL